MPTRKELWQATGRDPVAVIRELAKDGYGPEIIARIVGISRPTVKIWAAKFGIDLPKRTASDKIMHSGRSRAAIEAARERNTLWIEWSGGRERLSDAAKRLGVTTDCIRDRIKRWGVETAMTEPRRPAFYGVTARKPADSHPWRESVVDKRQAELQRSCAG